MTVRTYQSLFHVPQPPSQLVPFQAWYETGGNTQQRIRMPQRGAILQHLSVPPEKKVNFQAWYETGGNTQQSYKVAQRGAYLQHRETPPDKKINFQAWSEQGGAVNPSKKVFTAAVLQIPELIIPTIQGILTSAYPWGYDIQSFQPQRWPVRNYQAGALRSRSSFAVFDTFVPWSETSPSILVNKSRNKAGILAIGDSGINFPTAVTTIPFFWGGIDPPQFWKRPRLAAGGLRGSTQFLASSLSPIGWEIQSFQPPHPRREKAGVLFKGTDGIEKPFIPPTTFVPWGYDIQSFQPQRWPVRNYQAGALRSRSSFAIFDNFVPFGWFVQPWQPPHPHPERGEGATARGDDGTQFPKVNFLNFGWFVQPWQPPHPRSEKGGAIMPKEDGIEAPFIFVPPPPVIALYHRYMINAIPGQMINIPGNPPS
jgi:hypothetical protein